MGAVFQVFTITSQGGPAQGLALLLNYYDATIVLIAISLVWVGLQDLFIISFRSSSYLLEAIVATIITTSSNKKDVAKSVRYYAKVSAGC